MSSLSGGIRPAGLDGSCDDPIADADEFVASSGKSAAKHPPLLLASGSVSFEEWSRMGTPTAHRKTSTQSRQKATPVRSVATPVRSVQQDRRKKRSVGDYPREQYRQGGLPRVEQHSRLDSAAECERLFWSAKEESEWKEMQDQRQLEVLQATDEKDIDWSKSFRDKVRIQRMLEMSDEFVARAPIGDLLSTTSNLQHGENLRDNGTSSSERENKEGLQIQQDEQRSISCNRIVNAAEAEQHILRSYTNMNEDRSRGLAMKDERNEPLDKLPHQSVFHQSELPKVGNNEGQVAQECARGEKQIQTPSSLVTKSPAEKGDQRIDIDQHASNGYTDGQMRENTIRKQVRDIVNSVVVNADEMKHTFSASLAESGRVSKEVPQRMDSRQHAPNDQTRGQMHQHAIYSKARDSDSRVTLDATEQRHRIRTNPTDSGRVSQQVPSRDCRDKVLHSKAGQGDITRASGIAENGLKRKLRCDDEANPSQKVAKNHRNAGRIALQRAKEAAIRRRERGAVIATGEVKRVTLGQDPKNSSRTSGAEFKNDSHDSTAVGTVVGVGGEDLVKKSSKLAIQQLRKAMHGLI